MRLVPIIVYIFVVVICLILPSSEGYDTFLWKLLIAQIYAIPSLIVAFFVTKKLKSDDRSGKA